jgi:hypothetical protein
MLRTIVVFAVVVGAAYLIVPHDAGEHPASVSYRQPVRDFAAGASFTVLAPSALPPGWYANHVRETESRGVPEDLDAGFYDDPDRTYVALEESNVPARVFLRSQGLSGHPGGQVDAAGRRYEVWPGGAGPSRVALVAALPGGGTLVLDGGAPLPVLLELAQQLAPTG